MKLKINLLITIKIVNFVVTLYKKKVTTSE